MRQDDGSIKVQIYRKPTHTDQYLSWSSNHPVQHKMSVVRTLHHRADTVISDEADKAGERDHVNKALANCGYPKWALKSRPTSKSSKPAKDRSTKTVTI